ncbi:MAG: aspartate/glutamate racemase family protein [Anaerovoracaceae bacterium]
MKRIGIVGGVGWPSTVTTYTEINRLVEEKLGNGHCAELILAQTDFKEMTKNQEEGNWERVGELIADSAARLKAGGADFYIVACNTVHTAYPYFRDMVDLPCIHIVDPCGEALSAIGAKKVGLMGSRYTMEGDFFRSRLESKFNMEVLIPDEPHRTYIHDALYSELTSNIIREETHEKFRGAVNNLIERGADAIILGCTEFGLIVKQEDSSVPVIDTTIEQAKAAVEYALK